MDDPKRPAGRVHEAGQEASEAKAIAATTARKLAEQLNDLDRDALLEIVAAFRRELLPARKPGRQRSKEITAAHSDWKPKPP
jgi:hypothetical protein